MMELKTRRAAQLIFCMLSGFFMDMTFVKVGWAQQKPVIAIVIDDMGNQQALGYQAIAIEGSLTYSFLPFSRHAAELAEAARIGGKELMLHSPMESMFQRMVETTGLTRQMTEIDVNTALFKQLQAIPNVSGVNNHMGSLLTQDAEMMRWVMNLLKQWRQADLYFVDSMTTPLSVAGQVAAEYGLPVTSRKVFLDHQPGMEYVGRQFDRLISIARGTGFALAIGHPKQATLKVLRQKLGKLQELGVELVSVSTYIALKQQQETGNRVRLVRQMTESGYDPVRELEMF